MAGGAPVIIGGMGKLQIAFLTCLVAGVARADSSEEAMARLKAKEAARAALATQPAPITAGEVEEMRRQINALRIQLADARAEIERLKAQATQPKNKEDHPKPAKAEDINDPMKVTGSLTEDGPGLYQFRWHDQTGGVYQGGQVPNFAPHIENITARSRAVAIEIATKKGIPLSKAFDADGNERITNCWKVKNLTEEELTSH